MLNNFKLIIGATALFCSTQNMLCPILVPAARSLMPFAGAFVRGNRLLRPSLLRPSFGATGKLLAASSFSRGQMLNALDSISKLAREHGSSTGGSLKDTIRDLSKRLHPDLNKQIGSDALIKQLNRYNEVLADFWKLRFEQAKAKIEGLQEESFGEKKSEERAWSFADADAHIMRCSKFVANNNHRVQSLKAQIQSFKLSEDIIRTIALKIVTPAEFQTQWNQFIYTMEQFEVGKLELKALLNEAEQCRNQSFFFDAKARESMHTEKISEMYEEIRVVSERFKETEDRYLNLRSLLYNSYKSARPNIQFKVFQVFLHVATTKRGKIWFAHKMCSGFHVYKGSLVILLLGLILRRQKAEQEEAPQAEAEEES